MTTIAWLAPGSKVWYLYRIPGSGMTGQEPVTVIKTTEMRVTIRKENGRKSVVHKTSLRPTN